MSESLRIDKWLWHARFCKTRAIAQGKTMRGHIRINGQRVQKPSAPVRVGDVMTLPVAGKVMAIKILGLGVRRGPPSEAQTLYESLSD